MKRKHLRREILDDGRMRMFCGLTMTRDQYQAQHESFDPRSGEEYPFCQRCRDNRVVYDLRMEEEQEKLVKAGFLEADMGPNRRWNEY